MALEESSTEISMSCYDSIEGKHTVTNSRQSQVHQTNVHSSK